MVAVIGLSVESTRMCAFSAPGGASATRMATMVEEASKGKSAIRLAKEEGSPRSGHTGLGAVRDVRPRCPARVKKDNWTNNNIPVIVFSAHS
jgi:hypothetical protein